MWEGEGGGEGGCCACSLRVWGVRALACRKGVVFAWVWPLAWQDLRPPNPPSPPLSTLSPTLTSSPSPPSSPHPTVAPARGNVTSQKPGKKALSQLRQKYPPFLIYSIFLVFLFHLSAVSNFKLYWRLVLTSGVLVPVLRALRVVSSGSLCILRPSLASCRCLSLGESPSGASARDPGRHSAQRGATLKMMLQGDFATQFPGWSSIVRRSPPPSPPPSPDLDSSFALPSTFLLSLSLYIL